MFRIVLAWEATKEWLSHSFGVSHLTLHLLVGLGLFFLFARLMRRPIASPLPLLPVAVLELLNEASDLTRYLVSGWPWSPSKTAVEVAMTLVPPFIVMLLARAKAKRQPRTSDGGAL
jgi:hypothetical protein